MIKAKILEIFQSIQGEGKYVGIPQVFVRFFECNMHCVWCDTPHSIGDMTRHFQELTLEEVFGQVKSLWGRCHSVSLTGGEPLLHKDFMKELLPLMRQEKMTSYLETNGILPEALQEVIADIDIVAMDLKLPTSTHLRAYWDEHEAFLKIAVNKDVFIKAVITSDTKTEDVMQAMDLVSRVDPQIVFILQPNYFEMRNGIMARCLEFQNYCSKYLKNVRILPQVHKFMKLR
jgi:7-cyano-7-deazaguanosine (preQ0) biosynthesis protein QueE